MVSQKPTNQATLDPNGVGEVGIVESVLLGLWTEGAPGSPRLYDGVKLIVSVVCNQWLLGCGK